MFPFWFSVSFGFGSCGSTLLCFLQYAGKGLADLSKTSPWMVTFSYQHSAYVLKNFSKSDGNAFSQNIFALGDAPELPIDGGLVDCCCSVPEICLKRIL